MPPTSFSPKHPLGCYELPSMSPERVTYTFQPTTMSAAVQSPDCDCQCAYGLRYVADAVTANVVILKRHRNARVKTATVKTK